MARIRSIKPEFWKSEAIAALSWPARLAFIALWSYVDDNGVGRDNHKLIAAELFPLEEDPRETAARVAGILDELARASRIARYTNAGKAYLFVNNWSEHQKIDRPNKARYPKPDAEGSDPLTCGNLNPREPVAEPSRNPREAPAAGAVELGSREQGTGIPPTAAEPAGPAAQPALIEDERPTPPRSINVRAQALATTYSELVPLSKFPAVLGIAKQAIRAGYDDPLIDAALRRIAAEGRPLTVDVLRVELEGQPSGRRGHQPFRNPTDPDAYGGTL